MDRHHRRTHLHHKRGGVKRAPQNTVIVYKTLEPTFDGPIAGYSTIGVVGNPTASPTVRITSQPVRPVTTPPARPTPTPKEDEEEEEEEEQPKPKPKEEDEEEEPTTTRRRPQTTSIVEEEEEEGMNQPNSRKFV